MSKSFIGGTSKTAVSQCAETNKQRDVLTKQVNAGQRTVVATAPRMGDGGSREVITRNRSVPFEASKSGVRWGNQVRPTPKWKRPFLSLRDSLRYSLVQILLEECRSLFRRIQVRARSRELAFGLVFHRVLRAYPTRRASDRVIIYAAAHATRHRLPTEETWIGLLDVRMVVQSWIAGIEFGVQAYSASRCRERPSCDSRLGGNFCHRENCVRTE
jgi:hypothetical protein